MSLNVLIMQYYWNLVVQYCNLFCLRIWFHFFSCANNLLMLAVFLNTVFQKMLHFWFGSFGWEKWETSLIKSQWNFLKTCKTNVKWKFYLLKLNRFDSLVQFSTKHKFVITCIYTLTFNDLRTLWTYKNDKKSLINLLFCCFYFFTLPKF